MGFIVSNLIVWLVLGVLLGGAAMFLQIRTMTNLSDDFSTTRLTATFICAMLSSVSFLLFLIAAVSGIVNG